MFASKLTRHYESKLRRCTQRFCTRSSRTVRTVSSWPRQAQSKIQNPLDLESQLRSKMAGTGLAAVHVLLIVLACPTSASVAASASVRNSWQLRVWCVHSVACLEFLRSMLTVVCWRTSQAYQLDKLMQGETFFQGFDFFTAADPTHGALVQRCSRQCSRQCGTVRQARL